MKFSPRGMRQALFDPSTRSVRLAVLEGSDESADTYTRVNCEGLGRLRIFRHQSMILNSGSNLVPKRRLFRTIEPCDEYATQCFQLAGCNWACWYCFVDDALLRADGNRSRLIPVSEMIDLFLSTPMPHPILDLSGGQPELVPEWALWSMQELDAKGLRGRVHVWVDDNLSGSYMERFCTQEDIEYMASFPLHSRTGCFKGLDDLSIRTNTASRGASLGLQLRVAEQLISRGFDTYFYLTLLGPFEGGARSAATNFVGRLKDVHPLLPLRVVPLEIRNFRAVSERVGMTRESERRRQYEALRAWEEALAESYTSEQLMLPYESIRLT